MNLLPSTFDLIWLGAGLLGGLILGVLAAPKIQALWGGQSDGSRGSGSEAELRASLERMREVQVELRDRLTSTINRHNQQIEQMNTIHSAAMAQAEEEFKGMQIKLLRVIDAVEKGEADRKSTRLNSSH